MYGLDFPLVYASMSVKDERLFQLCDDRKRCCPFDMEMWLGKIVDIEV